jgi:DNA-binding beta-propeller fold protein YncE
MRAALFQIWLNRDHSLYSQLTGKDMSLGNWTPSNRMRLYIRKDITSQIWNYGVGPSPEEIIADPYEGKQIDILADTVIGEYGTQPGQFNRPRGVAVAADGTIYVADTDNHRIQHVDSSGNVLHIWGSFADSSVGEAPGGTFYEPWGIDVGPDGSVYVADTWNHRIQKFTPDGIFLNSWGYFGQAESIYAMWGPRDVHVDQDGKVFVSDTGNKRILVFDQSGNAITEFGQAGYALGEFDEPVGLAASDTGRLFVADTWNQRIQEFILAAEDEYQAVNSWDVVGWYGQSLDNKPFIATNSKDHLFATDPDAYRVLVFSLEGEIIGYFGDLSTGVDGFELVGGIAADSEDGVWVSDSGNSRLMHFTLP